MNSETIEDLVIDETGAVEEYETSQEYIIDTYDYSNYFENIQTMLILILACLVAIGAVLGWVGAKHE